MALILADRVRESTTTVGTGAFALGGAQAGFQAFSAVLTNGDTTYYACAGNTEWEVGIGTWNTGNTLSRTTVLASSNSGNLVNFSAGSKDIFITYPASRSVYQNEAGTSTVQQAFSSLSATSANITTATITSGTVSTTPASGNDIANKTYVDTTVSSGITYHSPVKYEVPNSTGNLNAIYNQPGGPGVGVGATLTNNGTLAAFAPDGPTAAPGDRILVYNQTNAFENGVYTVTTVGNGSTPWVLTRATDADTYAVKSPNGLGLGDAFFITSGNTGAGETYVCNTSGTITFGTTAINFVQVSSAQIYSAGTGLTLSGTQFSITNTGVGAATYGSASSVPVIGVNAQGQITSATNTTIAITGAQVSGNIAGSAGSVANALTAGSYLTSGGTYDGSVARTFAVDATTTNTASKVVARDASGNFSAGTITASLSGNATSANTATNISGGTANQIPYQASAGTTTFVAAPTTANTYLGWTGSAYTWAAFATPNSLTFNNGGAGGASGSTFNGSSALTVSYNTVGAPSTTGTNATGTWGISITGSSASTTGNAATATALQTARNINAVSFNGTADITIPRVRAIDDRTAAPADGTTGYATFGFGSWNNNNTSPYADFWLMRSYTDASGGSDNMVMFRKDALGMRVWQQSYGSATAFATFKDVAWTDGTNASGTWNINITGSAGSVDYNNLTNKTGGTGTYTTSGDYRAPIFYDSNNTAYYGDFAGVSYFSKLIAGSTSGINTGYNGVFGTNQVGAFSGNKIIYFFNDGSNIKVDAYDYGVSGALNIQIGGNGGYTTIDASTRSPIFYDSNNTAYYGDFASISKVVQIDMASYLRRTTSAAGYLEGWYGTATDANSSMPIYTIGGSYQPGTTSLGNMYGIGYTVGNGTTNPGLGSSGWGLYVASAGTSRIFLDSDNGYGIATNSWRAPIFYDSNNTSYYGDFASTSNLNVLAVQRAYAGYDAGVTGSFSCSDWFRSSGGTGWYNASYGGGIYMADSTWVRVYNNKNFLVDGGYGQSDQSWRAPIFYDSSNTAYYGDFASVSLLSGLDVYGGGLYDDQTGFRLPLPGQAAYTTSASSVTGAIKIRIPTAALGSNTMMAFTVSVYTYDALSFDIRCGGYNYSDASKTWYNVFAYMLSGGRGPLTVRFGWDGTSQCVWIGQLATTWSYPQVTVRDFMGGYSGFTGPNWRSGWSVSFEASSFYSVSQTQTVYPLPYSTNNSSLFYGVGYYDSDNTAYYGNFDSLSNINTLSVATINNLNPATGAWHTSAEGKSRFFFASNSTTYFRTGSTFIWRNNGDTGIATLSSTGSLRVASGGDNFASYQLHVDGTGYASSDFRAPIFYDSNNTAFYTDPASTSVVNNVQITTLGVGTAASGTTGEIRATNNITAYYSDERLKTRLGLIDNALDKLLSLEGFYYEANEVAQALGYTPVREVGVSAQAVQKILPEVVAPAPIDDKYLTVRYEKLVPLLIEAIKELSAKVDELQKRN